MERFRPILLAVALAAPVAAAARDRAPAGITTQPKRNGQGSFLEKPIDPMPEREQKPRGGWNGFYGGLSGGGAPSDR